METPATQRGHLHPMGNDGTTAMVICPEREPVLKLGMPPPKAHLSSPLEAVSESSGYTEVAASVKTAHSCEERDFDGDLDGPPGQSQMLSYDRYLALNVVGGVEEGNESKEASLRSDDTAGSMRGIGTSLRNSPYAVSLRGIGSSMQNSMREANTHHRSPLSLEMIQIQRPVFRRNHL